MRLAAQQRGGYYAAAPEAIRHLAQFVRVPPATPVTILDPCAGRGEALETWADALGIPLSDVYAIELEDDRAAECHDRLGARGSTILGPCSIFGCRVSTGRFSMVWLNPPFDDAIGGGARVEAQFLYRATQWLAPGGLMALACPADVAADRNVRFVLLRWFENVSIEPFPAEHRPYNEVVVFGTKRKTMVDPDDVDWRDILAIGRPCYELPESGDGIPIFEKTGFTDSELLRAVATSPLRKVLEVLPGPQLTRPPLELGIGHLALLLSSGHLDGLVEPPDEPPHVVRGVCRKKEYLKDVEVVEDTSKLVYSERIEMLVRTVGVDGDIRTLGGEKEGEGDGVV